MSGNHHRSLSFMPTCTLRNAISNQSNFVPTLQQVLKCQSREIFIQFKVLLKVLYSTVSELLRCNRIVVNINCNLTIIEGWTEVKRSLALSEYCRLLAVVLNPCYYCQTLLHRQRSLNEMFLSFPSYSKWCLNLHQLVWRLSSDSSE